MATPNADAGGHDESISSRLANLFSRLKNVHERQPGQWEAQCPSHDDANGKSLAIGKLGTETIGIYCHAGCSTEAVMQAVGLPVSSLCPPRPPLRVYGGDSATGKKIVATYDYRDTDGTLLFQVVRYDPKDFRQRRPSPSNPSEWVWSIKGTKVVPYRLPELIAADRTKPVFICEGEKDCDRLAAVGLVATCNAMGAAAAGAASTKCKWRPEHAEYLRGRVAIIVPDNDQPGRDHAAGVAASLAGIAASVKILALPGVAEKGDASDWLDNGGTAEQLLALSAAATDANAVEPIKLITSAEFFSASYKREYIIDGILTAGEPCVIGGRSKTLKTSLVVDLALALGTGGKFLNQFQAQPRRVALLSGESGDYTIQETALRISFAYGYDPHAANVFWGFDLPCLGSDEDLASLNASLIENKIEVLIVDPVYLSLMGDATRGLNASNLFDVGPLLMRIAKLCKAAGTTLILLHHCRKNSPNEKYEAPELEELSMSGFGEFARQWILLGRQEAYQFNGTHKLWVSVGGSAGHSGLWSVIIDEGTTTAEHGRRWEIEVKTAHESNAEREKQKEGRQVAKRDELCEKVFEIISHYPGGETATFLRERVSLPGSRFNSIAEFLEGEGRIESCDVEKNGRIRKGWRPFQVTEFGEFSDSKLDALQSPKTTTGPPDKTSDCPVSGGALGAWDKPPDMAGGEYIYIPPQLSGGLDAPIPAVRSNHDGDESGVRLSGANESSDSECEHDWLLTPDPFGRKQLRKKQCTKCKEIFGYVDAE